jgi:hypothetical protein
MKIEKIKKQLESVFNEIYAYTNVAEGDGPLEILDAVIDDYELSDVYDKWLVSSSGEDDNTEIIHPQTADDMERLLEAFEDALEQCQFEFEEYPEEDMGVILDTDIDFEDEDEDE